MSLIFIGSCSSKKSTQDSETNTAIYTCPMHPQIREKENIPCPLCGMDLVAVRNESKTTEEHHTSSHHSHHAKKDNSPTIHLQDSKSSILSAKTVTAEAQSMLHKVRIFGEVKPIQDEQIDYSWYYSGKVEEVLISYNQTEVTKEQPLIRVYSEEVIHEQQHYLELLRQRWLRTFYERKNLEAQIATIQRRLQQIGIDKKQLEQLEKEQKVQSTFTLKAPRTGTLMQALPMPGKEFNHTDTLFSIAALNNVWFTGEVYEKDLPFLKVGLKARIETSARPDTFFVGKLIYMGRILDKKTRTLPIRFEIDNKDLKLLPNLSGTAIINIPFRDIKIAVPHSSVLKTGQRSIVYVKEQEGVYRQRTVQTGRRSDEFIEILEGIEQGEKVVTDGAFLLDAEAEISGQGQTHQH